MHIIALDVPWPANYGGVIDIYYKAKALADAGVKVHLHCFAYGRARAEALDFCHEVHYYQRATNVWKQFHRWPYIVASRCSEALMVRLLQDNHPILCEGLHTTALLSDRRFVHRRIFVRAHNVEHDYYHLLAKSEPTWWKRGYYWLEAWKLKNYEDILARAAGIFPISQTDADYFARHFDHVRLLPAFSAAQEVTARAGCGEYVLYHGNLSVRENMEAATWLLRNVFAKLEVPCIIAGLNPTDALLKEAERYPHVAVRANLTEEAMRTLLRDAHVNILVTHQPTGLKLKLLNALIQGRFCAANSDMLAGSNLQDLCLQADDADTMIATVNNLMQKEFTEADVARRRQILTERYAPGAGAAVLVGEIFG